MIVGHNLEFYLQENVSSYKQYGSKNNLEFYLQENVRLKPNTKHLQISLHVYFQFVNVAILQLKFTFHN